MAELAEVSRGITESGEFRKGISSSSIVKNNSRERKTKLERERGLVQKRSEKLKRRRIFFFFFESLRRKYVIS